MEYRWPSLCSLCPLSIGKGGVHTISMARSVGAYKGDTPPAKTSLAFQQNGGKAAKWEHVALVKAIEEDASIKTLAVAMSRLNVNGWMRDNDVVTVSERRA